MFLKFGLVGSSGVAVNLLVLIACNKFGPDAHSIAVDLPLTNYNVRWYHVYASVAFLVANVWNFQLNRRWTFRSAVHATWVSEYLPFLVVGLAGLLANLGLLTLLLHPGSLFALSPDLFDDSSGFRTRLYWGQLIAICVVTPLSFALNKLWTFSAVRGLPRDESSPVPLARKS
jgi:putative flippase GtrA